MVDVPEKREVKPFEPPPWEREAFERLAREREREARRDAPQESPPNLGEPAEPESGAEMVAAAVEAVSAADGAAAPQVDVMLMALKDEEPDALEGVWKVGLGSALFIGALGLMLLVWGAVALARTLEAGPAGWMGSIILGLLGTGFLSLALWLGGRSLRKQGVL